MRNTYERNFKRLIICWFIGIFLCVISGLNSNIYAAINPEYSQTGTQVDSSVLDSATEEDGISLIGLVASFFISVGWLIHGIVAWTLELLTQSGMAKFPWMDQIVFNSIPILDVNFINPAEGSLMYDGSDYTIIGTVIRNVYFTGLSISLSFMGIVIAVMAIKLAISSIGSQKAKYKEAIVSWATALVLLFGMHFLIAFVFYLNEQLVTVASLVLKSTFETTTNLTIGSNTASWNGVVSTLGDYYFDQATKFWSGHSLTFGFRTLPIPTALYLVLVCQSLMFLFSYFKRFFYVIILAMLAPYVVIYDFLSSAISL